MSEDNQTGKTNKTLDLGLKILSMLVIPLILWGVRLQVREAIQDERISELQQDVQKNSTIATTVNQNSLTLVKLEAKIDSVGGKIDDIKVLLASGR